jgi:hypothetical protein
MYLLLFVLFCAVRVADVDPLPQGVVSMVMGKCGGEVYNSVCSGGSMFLLYEIIMQSLLASEGVLEFIARSIDYLKSQVRRPLAAVLFYVVFVPSHPI